MKSNSKINKLEMNLLEENSRVINNLKKLSVSKTKKEFNENNNIIDISDNIDVKDYSIEKEKLLTNACIESPKIGVCYKGKGEITNNSSVEIELPYYIDKMCTNFSIQLTPIYNGDTSNITLYTDDNINNNRFTVYASKNIKFYWIVQGTVMEYL